MIMSIAELIGQIENNLSGVYFLTQLITVICLFLYGYFTLLILGKCKSDKDRIVRTILAYPLGLAEFSLLAFVLVIVGIPYNSCSVIAICVLGIIITCVIEAFAHGRKELTDRLTKGLSEVCTKRGLISAVIVVLAAMLACSGVLSVMVSNDTMYHFSFYPRSIVYFGKLRANFDTYLTDVGQGCALINTLPYLFNFNETFGLQHMLNFSMVSLFYMALSEKMSELKGRSGQIIALILSVLLMFSLPFVVISKWILANDYFAAYMFIVAYIAGKRATDDSSDVVVLSILIAALSIMRIEGGVYATLFVLCISTLKYTNRELGLFLLLPVVILNAAYSARVFLTLGVSSPYCFLTPKKSILMIAIMLVVLAYLLVVRGRIGLKIFAHMDILIIAGLGGANLLLLIRDVSGYLDNLKNFMTNIMFTGGWGVLPVVIFSIYLVCLLGRGKIDFGYWDFMALSFILYAIAVTFMREGGLRPAVGDSGNRVLLQSVPLLLFAAANHIPELLKSSDDSDFTEGMI